MNYGELKTQFQGLLKRRDSTEAQRIGWLDEATRRVQRLLKVPAMEASVETALSSNELAIPDDYIRLKALTITTPDGDAYELKQRDLNEVLKQSAYQDNPRIYARRGSNWLLAPSPLDDTDIRIDYYQEIPALVDDTDENWLTIIAPYAIIDGAMTKACEYFLDKRAPVFEASFQQQINELRDQADGDELLNAQVTPAWCWPED